KDDMNDVLEKIIRAEALVVSGFPTFFSVNALTKTFIERMYPLKHNKMLTRGKLGIVVAGGFREPDVVADYLSFFFSWFKMELLGTLKIGGNAPCLSCGYGETCDYSNVTIMHGEGAQIKSEMFYSFENDEDSKQEALLLGQRLGAAL
ncbi:MAG: hypothetical protein PWQ96_2502, partial [Clostridia bacterium]|nr:hypothetical protein [Clostridia bacterium]